MAGLTRPDRDEVPAPAAPPAELPPATEISPDEMAGRARAYIETHHVEEHPDVTPVVDIPSAHAQATAADRHETAFARHRAAAERFDRMSGGRIVGPLFKRLADRSVDKALAARARADVAARNVEEGRTGVDQLRRPSADARDAREESPAQPAETTRAPKPERSPGRLRHAMDALLLAAVSHTEVTGREHLAQIKPEDKVVVVVTHVSGGLDLDMPVAIGALSGDLDLAITDQSTHHSPDQEKAMYRSLGLAGRGNFIPVSYDMSAEGGKTPGMFNPDDAEAMAEAVGRGKRVVVAANTPFPDEKAPEEEKVAAAKPGHMAAYLAAITGAKILPVGVQVGEPEGRLKRRPAEVVIGEPFELELGPELHEMRDILARRRGGAEQDGDSARFSELASQLRQGSREVFDRTMALRPDATKRG
ncbi:MAG TPA: hypothetical protein VHQ86_00800 [Candidatus Saccharimonadia bacterium]|nr:hypothetical protein [Candidatus Saccharimonadia bacterium]